ncbi:hypothetical protein ABEB36_000315 [Hypothenemus hampei]|uniref:Uncharacterized protein n=1 Tax=Hypothenemus hampei TaxID=57062 RepID=A0ABD1FAW0_HYPHA
MSAICQNFVQNAWKKELCSNCFKSKDEHTTPFSKSKVVTVTSDNIQSIIRDPKKSKPKLNVEFTRDLIQFIGYGGEDWLSEEEKEVDDSMENSNEDMQSDSDIEHEEIRLLTKKNTNFNTVSLGDMIEEKKSYAHLLLGKPILNSVGKKQTLLVSVTPFGEDNCKKHNAKNAIIFKEINIRKSNTEDSCEKEKSLLDEISETLERSNNSILTREKTPLREIEFNKKNVLNEEIKEKSDRKVSLTRANALKQNKPSEKPIYKSSIARIEVCNKTKTINNDNNNNTLSEGDQKLFKDIIASSNFIKHEKSICSTQLSQTREQAGKPDGREDPNSQEIPALPENPPPPLENHTSFLHPNPVNEKPKIPSKPVIIPNNINKMVKIHEKSHSLSTFSTKSNDSDNDLDLKGKRKAPLPPEVNNSTLYTRNPIMLSNGDSPVVREKEKRERNERANLLTAKMPAEENIYVAPSPAPRKSLSISTDNLVNNVDDKRKAKGRFSLRKFLRMSSNKDVSRFSGDTLSMGNVNGPKPRPRLVIVHPSELNGSKVEVVAKPDQIPEMNIEPLKPQKPQPPPRNFDNNKPPISSPPPKSLDVLNKQKAISRANSNSSNNQVNETVYANIGEVRSSIVPNKPVRTASMRERETQQMKHFKKNHYETIGSAKSERIYDYVNACGNRSSSPSSDFSDKNSPKSKTGKLNKRSESCIDVSSEYFKYGNIPRSMSLTYCGSETESEIYSPYSFYGSESEVTEDDHEWSQNGRTQKLRSKKGRSIVHKNLEDNYSAVVVANHEALAQVLENIQQTIYIQPALRGLKMSSNLRLTDFAIKRDISPIILGSKTFLQAVWGTQNVTLIINTGLSTYNTLHLGPFNLKSVTDFSDLVPSEYCINKNQKEKHVQAAISVLPWLQIHTIQSYSDFLKTKPALEEPWKDGFFVMLQLVNALKLLQAQGIEDLPLNLSTFILSKEMDKENHYRLHICGTLPLELTSLTNPEEQLGSLCMCALKALSLLHPDSRSTTLIETLLGNERSVSLSQVKAVLELSLWGPTDVILGNTVKERELTLQRWLDLQRATVLHGLVCTRVQLSVYEECHLLFLVRSNAKMMSDASILIESNNIKYAHCSKA